MAGKEEEWDYEDLEPSLRNVVEQSTLRMVFVGGKGGVGKTTTACSLACQLAKVRESVLVVSTDPAHNLSDAFGQKFGTDPTKVDGFPNLSCMEVEIKSGEAGGLGGLMNPAGAAGGDEDDDEAGAGGLGNIMKTISSIATSVPGVDEMLSFAQLIKHVDSMEYSVIVFDTAPTGHTLRLLSIPETMERVFGAIASMKDQMGGMLGQMSGMLGSLGGEGAGGLMAQMDTMRDLVRNVYSICQDPEQTTFVCVAIPEFLSLYETERLVQKLTELEIDTHNIVVNQILDLGGKDTGCKRCMTRKKMQDNYLEQIQELYGEDFHVVMTPQLLNEVRGTERLLKFGAMLLDPHLFGVGDDETGCSGAADTVATATGEAAGAGAGAGAGGKAASAAETSELAAP